MGRTIGMVIPIVDAATDTEQRCVQLARQTIEANGWETVGAPHVKIVPTRLADGPRFSWSVLWEAAEG